MRRQAGYPVQTLVRRERRHRRALLISFAVLIVLTTSPLVGHHLPLGFEAPLAGRDHLWALCLAALHGILTPVHGLFHLLFTAGVTWATVDRIRVWRKQRTVLGLLPVRTPGRDEPLAHAACAAGLDPSQIRVVDGLPSPAFTAGWWSPHVYVAASLPHVLSATELNAVLAHEAAHVRRRDPLRLAGLRFLSAALFWVPGLRRIADDVADEAEVIADDEAAAMRPLALASALVTLAAWQNREQRQLGIGFNHRDMLQRRVRRLAGDEVPPYSRLNRKAVGAAALVLALAWSSGAAAAHSPADEAGGHAAHCEHEGAVSFLHLFCPGYGASGSRHCPHR
jgi:Zn-dependent protease with chaperone function